MQVKDIVALLKEGKKPMVKLTDRIRDDGFGCAGMIARVLSWREDIDADGTIWFDFDYNEQRAHNLALDEPTWYVKEGKLGSAIEAGQFDDPNNLHEEVCFIPTDDVAVELADSPILAEYIKSGAKVSYVEWLEIFINANVPECMKPWGKI